MRLRKRLSLLLVSVENVGIDETGGSRSIVSINLFSMAEGKPGWSCLILLVHESSLEGGSTGRF